MEFSCISSDLSVCELSHVSETNQIHPSNLLRPISLSAVVVWIVRLLRLSARTVLSMQLVLFCYFWFSQGPLVSFHKRPWNTKLMSRASSDRETLFMCLLSNIRGKMDCHKNLVRKKTVKEMALVAKKEKKQVFIYTKCKKKKKKPWRLVLQIKINTNKRNSTLGTQTIRMMIPTAWASFSDSTLQVSVAKGLILSVPPSGSTIRYKNLFTLLNSVL